MTEDLGSLFLESVARHGPRTACEVAGQSLTYRELGGLACRLAGLIQSIGLVPGTGPAPPTLLAVSRSVSGYVGITGSLIAGTGYAPVNLAWPPARLAWLLGKTGARIIIADAAGLEVIGKVLPESPSALLIVLPESDDVTTLTERWPAHRFLSRTDLMEAPVLTESRAVPSGMAYTLFTSGSTGIPKGVQVSQAASRAMVQAMAERYPCQAEDRFTQFADFTWDPSIVDMFMAWQAGGCICCPSAKAALLPDQFMLSSRATVTHLVPTTLRNLKRQGALKPGRFPALRLVFAGGEPFPVSLAAAAREAAPGAVIVNIYGSQEYSIFATYEWDSRTSPEEACHGILPLGTPFPGSAALIFPGDDSALSPGGEEGELALSGPQLFSGYLDDPEGTRAVLVTGPAPDHRKFYRTGDRVRRDPASGQLCYLGRRDSQIKLAGIRIELGEIESALQQAAATESAVVLGWPVDQAGAGAGGIVAFVGETTLGAEAILAALRLLLPRYMLPRRIIVEEQLPKNANGKCDRKALADRLQAGEYSS